MAQGNVPLAEPIGPAPTAGVASSLNVIRRKTIDFAVSFGL